jgi:hypothetical protein
MPVSSFLGELGDSFRSVAERGGLNSIAPNFAAGVRQAGQSDLQRRLIESQIGLNQARQNPANRPPQRRVQSTQILANGNIGIVDAFTGEVVDTGARSGNRTQVIDVPGQGRMVFDPVTQSITPIASEQQIVEGQATRAAETASAETQARQDVTSRQELPAEIAKSNDFIDRAEGFIESLKTGSLDTGPIIGRFPAISDQAQLFEAFSGQGIVEAIGQATFGALSEGEREFLSSTVFSRDKNEDVNIELLERAVDIVKGAQQRAAENLRRIESDEEEEFAGFEIVN